MNENIQEIKVVCFAGLRKFFDEELIVRIMLPCTYANLLHQLGQEKPEAVHVLKNCRIAVDEIFVQTDSPLNPAKTVFIIPPSSGG